MTAPQPPDRRSDLAVLARDPLLRDHPESVVAVLLGALELREFAQGDEVIHEGDEGSDMFFVLEGRAVAKRAGMDVERFAPGDHFGEIGLVQLHRRSAAVVALTPLRLGRLTRAQFDKLAEQTPHVALHIMQGVVSRLGAQLVAMTDSVGLMLRERSLPRRTSVQVRTNGEVRSVRSGTSVGSLLPGDVDGAVVVAALVDNKLMSLNTPLSSDAVIAPLSLSHAEGRAVYRRSAGLALLEAASRVAPSLRIRMGPSVSEAQVAYVDGALEESVIRSLSGALARLSMADAPYREELWTVEEARSYFLSIGERDTAEQLRSVRDGAVPLVSCGAVYALRTGPVLPRTGMLEPLRLLPHPDGLLLDFGPSLRDRLPGKGGPVDAAASLALEQRVPRFGAPMARDHRAWLNAMGITSAGSFNAWCVTGQVPRLIRVAEGFHEKRIGAIADAIAARRDRVRVITIAGPSSSGKTTFIKRLSVQLEIIGIHPVNLSLDDYYVDRDKTVRDAAGEFDFEALEALDLSLLHGHLAGLMAGETLHTARFDFKQGVSLPSGGQEVALHRDDILLVEGIHGLNPALLGAGVRPEQAFRIFIHPAATLSFDRLSRVAAADVRLLRRIVRDRHHRNYAAADNIARWTSVRRGEALHIFPFQPEADMVFDSSLAYEIAVIKVFADRYLLEVPQNHPSFPTSHRLRQLLDRFITIYPDHVPPTSLLREFIGGSGFEY